MYPKDITEYTPEDSERIVYQELKNQLPNSWDVFYSVPWTTYKRGRRIKSEADFIVCSPEYGFLCLEVKGGSQIRKENDTWYLSDVTHGERKLNESPYAQAEKSMYYFESVFSNMYNLRYSGIFGAGVVFPFCAIPKELNLDNRQRLCTIDCYDLNHLADRIKKMFKLWGGSTYGLRIYSPEQHRAYSKKGELISKGSFDLEDNQESCDLFYPFIEKCFLYIRENCLDEWNKGDKEDGMLTINRGIHGIIRVLDDLVNMLVEKGMIHPKNQDVEDMFVLLKYYLKPLTEYINGLTTEQRREIKKVFGGGGDVRFWRAYQKAIADVRVDFKPEGLDEYWLNEAKTFNDETRIMIGEIENKLKTIISSSLQEYFGTSWLVKGLPKNTYTKAKKLADEKAYDLQLNSDDDAEDINVWDFVSLADYVPIVTNGKNWSSFFEEMLVRPEETRIAGGKEAKTQWILRLSAIKNKLSKESYSVPVDEYSYVKSVYDWIMEMLTL